MNKLIIVTLATTLLISCKEQATEQAKQNPKVQVSVVTISKGVLPDNIEVTGKSVYFNKNTIIAPINGYVTKVKVQQGDKIAKGTVLFEMQTKEAYAMQKIDSMTEHYGITKVLAPTKGIITLLNVVKEGVYIDQGSAMCTVIGSNDIKIEVAVPFEYAKYVKIGNTCQVVLPDNTTVYAVFTKLLPQMDEQSQTMKVLANPKTTVFIPEKMIVKILINKGTRAITQILPKPCVQTNALMTKFWVMKLINDSTAIQVPVKLGNQTHRQAEILSPVFSATDRIISEGSYGLSDTTLIEIVK